jgi:glycosyltransferase involved in cell wall biosynthesis
MNNKLAVLLPIYEKDEPHFLVKALTSLNLQTYTGFDIIFLIDGPISSDLEQVIVKIPEMHTIRLKFDTNRGLPSVLNDGIRYCMKIGYTYIGRMDADDIAHRDRFKKQLDFLESNHDYDCLGTDLLMIDYEDRTIGSKQNLPKKLTINILKNSCAIVHASIVFRSTFFSKFGFYDISFLKSQDYDLWLTAVRKGGILGTLNEPLYYMRVSGSLVMRRKEEQKMNILIKRKHFKYWYLQLSVWRNYLIYYSPMFIINLIIRAKGIRYSYENKNDIR